MATLTYSTNNGNTVSSLEEIFASFVNVSASTVSATSAHVEHEIGGMLAYKFTFDYVLTDGTSNAAKVHSFILKGSPAPFSNPEPLATFDAGPGNAFINIGTLPSYHGTGDMPSRIGVFFSGNDVISNLGAIGRTLKGYAGNDQISAGSGKDRIDGGTGADIMRGGNGEDYYWADNAGDNVLESEFNQFDKVYVGSPTATVVTWVLDAGQRVEEIEAIGTRAVNLTGNEFHQKLIGNAAANVLRGNVLGGPAGADAMEGGDGNDTYWVDHVGDVVTETVYDDGLETLYTSVSYTSDLEVMRAYGAAAIRLVGGASPNKIFGNDAANEIRGEWGADTLTGNGGNDAIDGGFNNDTIFGGLGNDTLNGGFDNDTVNGGAGNDTIYGFSGKDSLLGGAGDDKLFGGFTENIADLADKLDGGIGNDVLMGNHGNDVLLGGAGADTLNGGLGADAQNAGLDDDRDVFIFASKAESGMTATTWDKITNFDFQSGNELVSDKIDLTALNTVTFADITINTDGLHVLVSVNVDGTPAPDFSFQVLNIASLSRADFLLA